MMQRYALVKYVNGLKMPQTTDESLIMQEG